MNPTLKGIDQWPNTAPALGVLDASYSATQEDRLIKHYEFKSWGVSEVESLPPSSPATPSESPERVETADEAFDAWWLNPANPFIGDRYQAKTAYLSGYAAGRMAK